MAQVGAVPLYVCLLLHLQNVKTVYLTNLFDRVNQVRRRPPAMPSFFSRPYTLLMSKATEIRVLTHSISCSVRSVMT